MTSEPKEPVMITRDQIFDTLRPVEDPEIGMSIVELGLIYDARYDEETKKIAVDMTLTSPMCPMGPQIMGAVKGACLTLPEVEDADVNLVWVPRWDPREHASEDAKAQLGIW